MNPTDTSSGEPRTSGSGDQITVVGGRTAPGRSPRPAPTEADATGAGDVAPPGRGPAGAAPRPGRRSFLLLVAVAVVSLAAAGTFAGLYLTKGSGNASGHGSARAAAVRATSKQFLTALFTFDAATLNQNVSRAQALATPAYAAKIASFYTAEQVDAAKKAQASSRADIKSLYLQNVVGDRASVFVVLSDTIANNKSPKPAVDQVRLVLTLQHHGGAWKVSNVKIFTAPASGAATPPTGTTTAPQGAQSTTTTSPPTSSTTTGG